MNREDSRRDASDSASKEPEQSGRQTGGQYRVDNLTGQNIAMGDGAQVNVTYIQPAATVPEKPLHKAEPAMVLIPAGPFFMGSDDDKPEEAPLHQVTLPDFAIARYPITNRQFATFIYETGRVAAPSLLWNGNVPPDEILNHPVAGVTWYEAQEFCHWLSEQSGRPYALPSEAQWEKAARSTDGRLYPWGNQWDPARCNHQNDVVTAIDAYPPQNEHGCADMVGNVREWTTTLWGAEYRAPDPKYAYPWQPDAREESNEPPGIRRVYRGGPADDIRGFRCSARGAYLPDKPGPRRSRHGFRIVLLDPSRRQL